MLDEMQVVRKTRNFSPLSHEYLVSPLELYSWRHPVFLVKNTTSPRGKGMLRKGQCGAVIIDHKHTKQVHQQSNNTVQTFIGNKLIITTHEINIQNK